MPAELEPIDGAGRLAWSFQSLAGNSRSLQLILRYEATLSLTSCKTNAAK